MPAIVEAQQLSSERSPKSWESTKLFVEGIQFLQRIWSNLEHPKGQPFQWLMSSAYIFAKRKVMSSIESYIRDPYGSIKICSIDILD